MNLKDIFKKKKKYKMSFKEALDLTELPIVTFVIEGNKYNFLLDTGCTISILNISVFNMLKNAEFIDNTVGTVFGIDGSDKYCAMSNIKLNYRDMQYEEEFQVTDMDKPFGKIKESSGVSLHGILGTRFFEKYKYVLNFDEMIAESRC